MAGIAGMAGMAGVQAEELPQTAQTTDAGIPAPPWLLASRAGVDQTGYPEAPAQTSEPASPEEDAADAFVTGSQNTPGNLELGSVSAIVYDLATEEILFSRYPHASVPVASLTKLMSALVVLRSGADMDEWLEVRTFQRPDLRNGYSRIRPGSRLARRDLLRLALMASENRATYTLAHHHPGGMIAFIDAMNTTAAELGMAQSHFGDPAGLSLENVSTAADLIRLIRALDAYPAVSDWSTTPYFTASFLGPRYQLHYGNTNRLVHRRSWDLSLSKTGYLAEAGRCLALQTRVQGREIAIVLLDSFGKLTHISDAIRVQHWLTTGNTGKVATAAREYRRDKLQALGLDADDSG